MYIYTPDQDTGHFPLFQKTPCALSESIPPPIPEVTTLLLFNHMDLLFAKPCAHGQN